MSRFMAQRHHKRDPCQQQPPFGLLPLVCTELDRNHVFTGFVGGWLCTPLTSVRHRRISSPFKETECTKGRLLPHNQGMKLSADLLSTQCSCSFAGLTLITDHRKPQGHALKEAQIQLVMLVSWQGVGTCWNPGPRYLQECMQTCEY